MYEVLYLWNKKHLKEKKKYNEIMWKSQDYKQALTYFCIMD